MEFVDIYVPAARISAITARKAKTIRVPKDEYQAIKDLIMRCLRSEPELSLAKLIDLGKQQLDGNRQDGQLSWLIVQVKNDLEFRDLIQTTFDDTRNQIIRLRASTTRFYGS